LGGGQKHAFQEDSAFAIVDESQLERIISSGAQPRGLPIGFVPRIAAAATTEAEAAFKKLSAKFLASLALQMSKLLPIEIGFHFNSPWRHLDRINSTQEL
jgi:hypothetical protein